VFVGERSKPDEAGGERDHLLKALQETQRAYEKLALIGVSLALNVRFTPKCQKQTSEPFDIISGHCRISNTVSLTCS